MNSKLYIVVLKIYLKSILNFFRLNLFKNLISLVILIILSSKTIKFFDQIKTSTEKQIFQTILFLGIILFTKKIVSSLDFDKKILQLILGYRIYRLIKLFITALFIILAILILKRFEVFVVIQRYPVQVLATFLLIFGLSKIKIKRDNKNREPYWRFANKISSKYLASSLKLHINLIHKNHYLILIFFYGIAGIISFYLHKILSLSFSVSFLTFSSCILCSHITICQDDIGICGKSLDQNWIKKNIFGELIFYFSLFTISILLGIFIDIYLEKPISTLTILGFLGSNVFIFTISLIYKFLFPNQILKQILYIVISVLFFPMGLYQIRKVLFHENS